VQPPGRYVRTVIPIASSSLRLAVPVMKTSSAPASLTDVRLARNWATLVPARTAAAAARTRGIDAREGSAESLPFADRAFDAVFSNAVLHWVRNQDAMMAEVRRVLKPSGRFVAEMAGHGNLAAVRVAFMTTLARHGQRDGEEGVNCYPTPNAYRRRLERNGFHVERIELIPRPTPLPVSGMEGWLRTFRRGVLAEVPEPLRETVVQETAALLEPVLRVDEGRWTADYLRLRFIATA